MQVSGPHAESSFSLIRVTSTLRLSCLFVREVLSFNGLYSAYPSMEIRKGLTPFSTRNLATFTARAAIIPNLTDIARSELEYRPYAPQQLPYILPFFL